MNTIIRGEPVNNALFGNSFGNAFDRIEMQINVRLENSYESPSVWSNSGANDFSLFQNPIALNLDGFNADPNYALSAWQTLVSVAMQIGASNLNYDLLDQNSNSVIGTLLSVLGFGPARPNFTTPGGANW